jgi:CRISPR-associated protein Cmr3
MGKMTNKHQQKKAPKTHEIQQQKQQRIAQAQETKQVIFQPCPKGQLNLQFTPMDTWFFRESRPHDAVGASELSSLFPPPVKTLLGAVRTFLGDSLAVNWKKFNAGDGFSHAQPDLNLIDVIGNSENLGQLSVNGAWVCKNGQRLYPAPCYLMQKDKTLTRLHIGKVVECDLGKVRLPELSEAGYKGLEQTWVTAEGWQKLLDGETPTQDELVKAYELFSNEPRLGIARNNQTRSVIESKLYQTQHLRLKEGVTIQLDIKGLDERLIAKLPQQGNEILRLGGEGRMTTLTAQDIHPAFPKLKSDSFKKFMINFITPAYFGEENHQGRMFPENFKEQEINGQTVWRGAINKITFIIEAAVIGKVHREGGWDMKKHEPRAVKSYIPAGSAWFCRLDDESLTGKEVIEKLNGQCIGAETEWGRGQILIGVWDDTAKTEEKK